MHDSHIDQRKMFRGRVEESEMFVGLCVWVSQISISKFPRARAPLPSTDSSKNPCNLLPPPPPRPSGHREGKENEHLEKRGTVTASGLDGIDIFFRQGVSGFTA